MADIEVQPVEVKKKSGGKKKKPKGPSIVVNVGYKVATLSAIEVAGTFDCTLRFLGTWEDPGLVGVDVNDPDWREKAYDPQLDFKNANGELDVVEEKWMFKDSTTGKVKWVKEVRGTFTFNPDLRKFPIDTQYLPIIVKSLDKHKQPGQITFVEEKGRVNPVLGVCQQPDYDILKPLFVSKKSDALESSKGKQYDECYIVIPVKRVPDYYVWNLGAFTFLIVTMNFIAFGIPLEDLGDRMGVTLTLVLTAVAFKFVVADSLPNIPYLTHLDKYMIFNFMFLYLIAMENWLITYWDDEDARKDVDDACLYIFIGLVFVSHIFFAWFTFRKHPNERPVVVERSGQSFDKAFTPEYTL